MIVINQTKLPFIGIVSRYFWFSGVWASLLILMFGREEID
jgi:hypothetical protein